MKHTMKIMIPFLMIAGLLTGCGSQESIDTTVETTQATEAVTTAAVTEKETQAETEKAAEVTEETKSDNSDNKSLVVYFTPAENSGTDAISSATVTNWNGENMGAAQVLANMIHQHTDSDLFSIRTTAEYPLEYNDLADYAKSEQDTVMLRTACNSSVTIQSDVALALLRSFTALKTSSLISCG